MEKSNLWKIITVSIISVSLLTAGYFFIEDKIGEQQQQESNGWETYQNEKFKFEIKYPSDWQIYVSDNPYDNIINIYKTGEPPFTYHSNITQVSIFPEGLGAEGSSGESMEITDDLTLAEEKTARQYVLNNSKKPFGYFANFKNTSKQWSDFGFVWASVEIKNREFICRDKTKNMNICEPLADGIDVIGDIDELEWGIVKKILATFRFIE